MYDFRSAWAHSGTLERVEIFRKPQFTVEEARSAKKRSGKMAARKLFLTMFLTGYIPGGGLPYKSDGGDRGKFGKEPLNGIKTSFCGTNSELCGTNSFPPLRGTNFKI